jgi:hypothetical protein
MRRHTKILEGLLRLYFTEFLEIVEPGLTASLGIAGVSFPGREELLDWPPEELIHVLTRRGDMVSIVVQVEPSDDGRRALEDRLLSGYLRLAVSGLQPVRLIVVYLSGGRPGVHLEWIVDQVDGEELVRVPYLAFGLEGCLPKELAERPSPVAWALAGLMHPIRRRRSTACQQPALAGGLTCQK